MSEIFGKPKEGVHTIRIFDFAFVDLLLTIILAYFTRKIFQSFLLSFIFWFVLGEALHIIFKVETSFLKIFKIKFNCENGKYQFE